MLLPDSLTVLIKEDKIVINTFYSGIDNMQPDDDIFLCQIMPIGDIFCGFSCIVSIIGTADCVVSTSTATTITCSVEQLSAGHHAVVILVPGLGNALIDTSASSIYR